MCSSPDDGSSTGTDAVAAGVLLFGIKQYGEGSELPKPELPS